MPTFLDHTDSFSDPESVIPRLMERAATDDGDPPAPEVSPETAGITVWDESPNATGHQSTNWPAESEETDAERLVRSGSEEAAREQRAATDAGDGSDPTD